MRLKQKIFMTHWVVLGTLFLFVHCSQDDLQTSSVFMATGIKIGEVSQHRAIIWTRLTSVAKPDTGGIKFQVFDKKSFLKNENLSDEDLGPVGGFASQLQKDVSLDNVENATPGTSGEVRLTYIKAGNEETRNVIGWSPVDATRDYTKQFTLNGLDAGVEYSIIVEGRKNAASPTTAIVKSSFITAPQKTQPQKVVFTVVTGTMFDTRDDGASGHKIYVSMLQLKPDFFVHTGDIVYYDHMNPYVTHIELARFSWDRMFGLPNSREFFNRVPAYFMKDDHDSWDNDCWPTMPNEMGLFTFEQGKQIFDEQVPMSDKKHYRTFRWGKDLQIWLVEGRDFRSPNHDPDGPDKSMWGREQVEWFKKTVNESDATFRILISPTPMVGPDHLWKANTADNHVNKMWSYEGDMLRKFISSQKNMFLICGDRHWQYISKDKKTGLLEYSCGPSTDAHATTLKNPDHSLHLFYRPKGGFLSVTVDRINGIPTAVFRHHDVLGDVENEDMRAMEM